MDPVGPNEHECWRIAFERCEQGNCCCANAKYHRPHCSRHAAHLATHRERWIPEMETRSEIGGRRGCIQMVSTIVLVVVLAMALSWWVVYR
jgi:hypothetical protein